MRGAKEEEEFEFDYYSGGSDHVPPMTQQKMLISNIVSPAIIAAPTSPMKNFRASALDAHTFCHPVTGGPKDETVEALLPPPIMN